MPGGEGGEGARRGLGKEERRRGEKEKERRRARGAHAATPTHVCLQMQCCTGETGSMDPTMLTDTLATTHEAQKDAPARTCGGLIQTLQFRKNASHFL
jgi:hypothetical protein